MSIPRKHESPAMRMPRVRFTVRRIMVAVAIAAAVLFAQMGRHEEQISRARYHERNIDFFQRSPIESFDTVPGFWMMYNGTGPSGEGPPVQPSMRIYKDNVSILPRWRTQVKARDVYHAEMA